MSEYERRTSRRSDLVRHAFRLVRARRLRRVNAAVGAIHVEWQR